MREYLVELFEGLLRKQEPLGKDFEDVLYGNIEELYLETEEEKTKPDGEGS